jgi:methionyl-tRNA formyltransferase/catechol 2,3-dioxygenase-like lactoylglutathione lyase family enzyme
MTPAERPHETDTPSPAAPLRVAYFGRSNEYLSVQGLEIALANPDLSIVSVTAGRGDETAATDGQLQRIARREGIALRNLRSVRRDAGLLDLVISFSNPVIFPTDFLSSVRFGVINLHPAPLPAYRGSHGIEHAILEGAEWFGATLHFCAADVDAGAIIDEERVPVGPHDNARTVWANVDEASLALLARNLERIVADARLGRRVTSRPQNETAARYFDRHSLPDEAAVDLSASADTLRRLVRAYDHPRRKPAYVVVGNRRLLLSYRNCDIVVADVQDADEAVAPRLDHVRVDVADIERSQRFYESALSLSTIVRYDTPTHTIVQMGTAGRPPGVELWQEEGVAASPSETEHLAFYVADVTEAVKHVRALHYEIMREPFTIGHETIAFIRDPDGHLIELNDFHGRR